MYQHNDLKQSKLLFLKIDSINRNCHCCYNYTSRWSLIPPNNDNLVYEVDITCCQMYFYTPKSQTNAVPHMGETELFQKCETVCLFPCLSSPGVMQTPFHRQNILCRGCQSVYPQAWVSIWGLTSNIENWPTAPTTLPSKRKDGKMKCNMERVWMCVHLFFYICWVQKLRAHYSCGVWYLCRFWIVRLLKFKVQ